MSLPADDPRNGTAEGRRDTVRVSRDLEGARWDAYVNAHSGACGYHLSAWRGVFERAFGHRTWYLSAEREDAITGVLPLVEMRSLLFGRFLVSLPFVNYGGVLATDEPSARALFAEAGRLARERALTHVELRHWRPQFPPAPARTHKVTMLLPLADSTSAMWDRLDRKVRNQVRKGEKSGLTWEIGGAERLDDFYAIFAVNMRDLGTPVYPKRFFLEVFRALPDKMFCFIVRLSGKAIAAGIGFRHRDVVEVPWASSLKEHRALCGNVLMYWRAIAHAIESGARTFDFGRSTPNEGTFHFKRQWGAEPHPLCWEYELLIGQGLPDHSPANPKYNLAVTLWKRLPVPIANLLGPGIVRSIP